MEFEGRENLKVFMELVALRFVIYRGKKCKLAEFLTPCLMILETLGHG